MLKSPLVVAVAVVLALGATSFPTTSLPEAPLRAFQVQPPLPVPEGVKPCNVTLLQHLFANSYGAPAVASYTPPTGCGKPGSWAAVIVNLTATSNGVRSLSVTATLSDCMDPGKTQYDRLAVSLAGISQFTFPSCFSLASELVSQQH
jgi:hypothetical protein